MEKGQYDMKSTKRAVGAALMLWLIGLLVAGCSAPLTDSTPAAAGVAGTPQTSATVEDAPPAEPLRILHVTSYTADWGWIQEQFAGFQDGLEPGRAVDYRHLELDAKNHPAPDAIAAAAAEAHALIESWQPDLIYLTDDIAQQYVGSQYVGTALPIVFSGVNLEPATYQYDQADNVTGVLEQEHSAATIQLLNRLVPDAQRIIMVVDQASMWDSVQERLMARSGELPPGVEIVGWDSFETFAEYQQAIAAYQTEYDAIGLLGVFGLLDEAGDAVPFEDVLRWTTEHSTLPDFSFWDSRLPLGTLCAVTVSGYEQGLAAGKLAHQILVDGVVPGSLPITATVRGKPAVSLARANELGISIDSSLLLSANVIKDYVWHNE